MVLYRLGRLMQLAGLVMLPLAIAGNLTPDQPMSLGQSLWLSGIGVGLFIVGYGLQQLGRPNG